MGSIDIIGFTVNASDFNTCDSTEIISSRQNQSIKNFSEAIVETWGRPVVIIDIAAHEGPDAGGNCNWSVPSVADFYQQMVKATPSLSLSGVIGIAFKDFSTLNNTAYRNAFADICTRYYAPATPNINYATPAVFSTAGDIGFTPCTSSYLLSNAIQTYPSPADYASISLVLIRKSNPCGDICFNISSYITSGQVQATGGVFQSGNCNSLYNPEIRDFASRNNYDPTIVMALVDKQNGYDPSNANVMIPSVPECSCGDYSGHSEQICCGAQTLAYYYGKANNAVNPTDQNRNYELTYLSIYGFLHGNDFNNELVNAQKGSMNSTDVLDILSRAFSVGPECQYVCANSNPQQTNPFYPKT